MKRKPNTNASPSFHSHTVAWFINPLNIVAYRWKRSSHTMCICWKLVYMDFYSLYYFYSIPSITFFDLEKVSWRKKLHPLNLSLLIYKMIGFDQWFSTGFKYSCQRTFGNFWRHFGCHTWVVGSYWHLVGRGQDARKHRTVPPTTSMTKDFLAQNVNSAAVEKPWLKQSILIPFYTPVTFTGLKLFISKIYFLWWFWQ